MEQLLLQLQQCKRAKSSATLCWCSLPFALYDDQRFPHTDKCLTWNESQGNDKYWATWSAIYAGRANNGEYVYIRMCPLLDLLSFLIASSFDPSYKNQKKTFTFNVEILQLKNAAALGMFSSENIEESTYPKVWYEQGVQMEWSWDGRKEFEKYQQGAGAAELKREKMRQRNAQFKRYITADPIEYEASFSYTKAKNQKREFIRKNNSSEQLSVWLRNTFDFLLNSLLFTWLIGSDVDRTRPFYQDYEEITKVMDREFQRIRNTVAYENERSQRFYQRVIDILTRGLDREDVHSEWRDATLAYNEIHKTIQEQREELLRMEGGRASSSDSRRAEVGSARSEALIPMDTPMALYFSRFRGLQ